MRILAVIPARYSSTRFPGKPLAHIAGKPMIQHVYERASSVFEHCVVATDDRRIEAAVLDFGGYVIMTASSHRSGTDRVAEALEKYTVQTGMVFDVVVNVQGDEPFIDPGQLTLLASLFESPDTMIGTLVKKMDQEEDPGDPNVPKVVVGTDWTALYFSRSPIPYYRDTDSERIYYKHIGLYGYRADILREICKLRPGVLEAAESLEQLRWLENGYRIRVARTDIETVSVDTPQDYLRVCMLAGNKTG